MTEDMWGTGDYQAVAEKVTSKYGFAFAAGLSIGLGLVAQLARVLLTEVGHGESDESIDSKLAEV